MYSIAIVDDCAEDAAALARMVRACGEALGEADATAWEIAVFTTVDTLSAEIILQNYLDKKRNGK